MKSCADSVISLPNGDHEGLTISIDLRELTKHPPEALSGTWITGAFLYDKFCKNSPITSFAGNERTESIFSAFYHQPEHLQPAWQKIKVLELLLYLGGLKGMYGFIFKKHFLLCDLFYENICFYIHMVHFHKIQ